MLTRQSTALHDLFGGSFSALTPAAADIDRPRLMRRLKHAARGLHDASDPLIAHLRRDGFRESKVIAYTHRPFDTRWLYADPAADADYLAHVGAANEFVVAGNDGAFVTRRATVEQQPATRLFPLYQVSRERRYDSARTANLSGDAREFVRRNGVAESDLFHHAVAMLSNGDTDSIPLPEDKHAIRSSAILGYRVATLFADDDPLAALAPHDLALRAFAVPSRTGKEARMLRGSALNVSDSWRDSESIETRPFTPDEVLAVRSAAADANLDADEALALLGHTTCDVFINDRALLRNVPLGTWRYTHRGAPLLRAWLRDRHVTALARPLLREEMTHLSLAARRITALLLLGPALRRNAEAMR